MITSVTNETVQTTARISYNLKYRTAREDWYKHQTEYDKQVHNHILNALLDGIRESAHTLPVLLEYICTPGLIIGLRWKDKDDGNNEKMLTEEQYEDLLALYSFLNYNQNWYGPIDDGLFNILETTREQFEHFIYNLSVPILYNEMKY